MKWTYLNRYIMYLTLAIMALRVISILSLFYRNKALGSKQYKVIKNFNPNNKHIFSN